MTTDSPPAVDGVVLITIDSLRYDAVDRSDTNSPTIDGLAESGVRFRNAFAPGNWTPFSFPNILGPKPVFAEGPDIGVSAERTLAETFQEHDVATAGYNASNGFLTSHWGYDRGFEEFETFTESDGSLYGRYLAAHPTVQGWVQLITSPFRRLVGRLRGDDRPQFLDASRLIDVEREATSFLERTEGPFFLWVHYMDTHTPYVPAPRHLREVTDDATSTLRMLRAHVSTGLGRDVTDGMLADLRDLYAASVHQVDASVGRLLDTLETQGVRDDTMVVVAGDHGEEFMEHGHLAHYPKLYDELAHVPLVIDHPEIQNDPIDSVTSLADVPPTLLDAADVPIPEPFEGNSLLPQLQGTETEDEPVISVAVRGEQVTQQPIPKALDDGELLVAARSDRWTYIHATGDSHHELYDRGADPTEQHDEWPSNADAPGVEEVRQAAIEHANRIERAASGDGIEADQTPEDVERRLKALGYQ